MEDYYSKPPIVLYGATVCDTPMGVSQTAYPRTVRPGHRGIRTQTDPASRPRRARWASGTDRAWPLRTQRNEAWTPPPRVHEHRHAPSEPPPCPRAPVAVAPSVSAGTCGPRRRSSPYRISHSDGSCWRVDMSVTQATKPRIHRRQLRQGRYAGGAPW
jgi:hypothetical protein